jgi:hypothetical protein
VHQRHWNELYFLALENLFPRLSILIHGNEAEQTQTLGVLDNFQNLRTFLLHRHIEAAETAIKGLQLCMYISIFKCLWHSESESEFYIVNWFVLIWVLWSEKLQEHLKFIIQCRHEAREFYKTQLHDKISFEELTQPTATHRSIAEYLEWIEFLASICEKEYVLFSSHFHSHSPTLSLITFDSEFFKFWDCTLID